MQIMFSRYKYDTFRNCSNYYSSFTAFFWHFNLCSSQTLLFKSSRQYGKIHYRFLLCKMRWPRPRGAQSPSLTSPHSGGSTASVLCSCGDFCGFEMKVLRYGRTQHVSKETKAAGAGRLDPGLDPLPLASSVTAAPVAPWSCFPPAQPFRREHRKYFLTGSIIPIMKQE